MFTKKDVGTTVYHPDFGDGVISVFDKNSLGVTFADARGVVFKPNGVMVGTGVNPTLSREPWPAAVVVEKIEPDTLVIAWDWDQADRKMIGVYVKYDAMEEKHVVRVNSGNEFAFYKVYANPTLDEIQEVFDYLRSN